MTDMTNSSEPGAALWIIEARTPDGKLDFADPQPERVFGEGAITGLSVDAMAKVVFQHVPSDVTLTGADIARWPARIDPRWVAREKTW